MNTTNTTKPGFKTADIAIIAIYLAVVLGITFFFWYIQNRRKKDSTSGFFTGGGKNPILIVGLSMFATIISSIGLLNVAGNSFTTRWMWAGINVALVAVTPFIALFIIPFYRRLKESTAYAYLEKRFNYSLRAAASLLFILYQLTRVAIVLYLPIVALSSVVEINEYLWICIVGLIVIATTAFGGFKAVIWSDAMQGIVLLLGISSVVVFGLIKTDWGSNTHQFHQILTRDSWKVGALQGGIAMIFLYNTINALHAFIASQEVTQRYKGTNTIGKIKKTLYITGALNIIMTLLFFGAGSVLFSYFTSTGWSPSDGYDGISLGLKNNGFLVYVTATLLPVGFLGFFVSAVFAASQSTISSGLSAISNSLIVDFIHKLKPSLSDRKLLIISKLIVGLFGFLSIGFGCILVYTKQDKIFDYFAGIVGLFNSPVIAIFLLGIFTKKANWKGCLLGIIVGFVTILPIWLLDQKIWNVDGKLTNIISFIGVYQVMVSFTVTLSVSWIASSLWKKIDLKLQKQNLSKLSNRTWWTRSETFKKINFIETKADLIEKWVKKGDIDAKYLTQINQKLSVMEMQLDKE